MVVVWGYGLMVWYKLNLTLNLIEKKEWKVFFPEELQSLSLLTRLFLYIS